MNIPRDFLLAESDPLDGELAFIDVTPFLHSQTTPEGKQFAARITEVLKKAGSTLSTTEVITRAETLNCVGCHFISGNVGEGIAFPLQIDAFQHVSERFTEKGEVGLRFSISPARRGCMARARR